MATAEQCEEAIGVLLGKIDEIEHSKRRKVPDRSVGCTVLDLDITWTAELRGGHVVNLHTDPEAKPQVRIVCHSDDLIDMINGDLNFAHAWATGRVHLDASVRDLLRLRSLA